MLPPDAHARPSRANEGTALGRTSRSTSGRVAGTTGSASIAVATVEEALVEEATEAIGLAAWK